MPAVKLELGVTDPKEYGYDDTEMPRYTGLRAVFSLDDVTKDIVVSMVGWDMDVEDESAVFVNDVFMGNLTDTGLSSAYGPVDKFLVPANQLRVGMNQIELIQREARFGVWSGYQFEKWAVKDLMVETALHDLSPVEFEIVDSALKPSSLFNVRFNMVNVGDGESPPTTARFLLSTDKTITISDTVISIKTLAPIAGKSQRAETAQLMFPLVNQGYYLGICIDSTVLELSSDNNCSQAVKLKNNVSMPPVIMLLLSD